VKICTSFRENWNGKEDGDKKK